MQQPWKVDVSGSAQEVQDAFLKVPELKVLQRDYDALWDMAEACYDCSPVASKVTISAYSQQIGDEWVINILATFDSKLVGGTIEPFISEPGATPAVIKIAAGNRRDIPEHVRRVLRELSDEAGLMTVNQKNPTMTLTETAEVMGNQTLVRAYSAVPYTVPTA